MRKFVFDNKSIKNRLRKSTLIVLLIQVLLFGVTIFGGGTIKKLSDEYFKILNERVLGRKNYIHDAMVQGWSNLTEFENYIQREVKQFGSQGDLTLMDKLLEDIAYRTVFILRQRGVTGIFVVLEAEENHEGFYIRDLDPSFNPMDNSDLLVERGSVGVARKINASLGSQWAYKFNLSDGDKASDFYYKPFLAAKEHTNIPYSDLGYWSRPFRLTEDDIEIITYSIPLIDDEGNPYGVIGIDLTLDYLRNSLPYDELAENKQGAYLLGIENEKDGVFENVVSSGPMFKRLVGLEVETAFTKKEGHQEIYTMNKNTRVDRNIYGSVQHIDLYNTNTPFENDKWVLIGIVGEKVLFKPIAQLTGAVIFSLIISLCLGIVAAYASGTWFMKPVTKLVQKVLKSNPNNPIVLTKTNITEIDELALAIESLSNKVADSSSKLSQIISMVNIPIGAFEYTLWEGKVFFTDTLFDILEIEKKDKELNYITSGLFKEIIKKITRTPEPSLENIYRYEKNDGVIRWIRMQTQEKKGKILGVIEDVTDDIIAKRKIEYERDHDLLTHLLNRRAFHVQVREKMQEKYIDNAAFVMWDLDNLKYINDTYGHDYGDQYIKTAATVLNEFTIYNAIVARMSGDEFYTFIHGYEKKEDIRKRVRDIQNKLHNTLLTMPDGKTLRIRASAGVAWYPDDSENYEELIKYSDFAMYEIKNTDKGNIGEFDKRSYDKDSILLYGKEELNHFIDGELVKFAFQPIVDAKTGKVFAYEALMRPQVEILKSPLDIIRLAQSQSKLSDIERITWFKSMEAFEEHKESFGDAKVFINSIPNYVLSEIDLERFEKRYMEHLDRIVIEIIETEQSNEQCTRIKQDAVARWGSHLALDDFGSGYNSEITLLILSPKFIKIDMTIVRGIDKDKNRQKLLKNILSYATNRQIKIIAEGVETKEEMDKLIEFGVDYMQGYYLGMPQMSPQPISKNIINEIKRGN